MLDAEGRVVAEVWGAANARVVAATPELLGLCRDIVLTWDDETPRAVVGKARALLTRLDTWLDDTP